MSTPGLVWPAIANSPNNQSASPPFPPSNHPIPPNPFYPPFSLQLSPSSTATSSNSKMFHIHITHLSSLTPLEATDLLDKWTSTINTLSENPSDKLFFATVYLDKNLLTLINITPDNLTSPNIVHDDIRWNHFLLKLSDLIPTLVNTFKDIPFLSLVDLLPTSTKLPKALKHWINEINSHLTDPDLKTAIALLRMDDALLSLVRGSNLSSLTTSWETLTTRLKSLPPEGCLTLTPTPSFNLELFKLFSNTYTGSSTPIEFFNLLKLEHSNLIRTFINHKDLIPSLKDITYVVLLPHINTTIKAQLLTSYPFDIPKLITQLESLYLVIPKDNLFRPHTTNTFSSLLGNLLTKLYIGADTPNSHLTFCNMYLRFLRHVFPRCVDFLPTSRDIAFFTIFPSLHLTTSYIRTLPNNSKIFHQLFTLLSNLFI